MKFFCHTHTHTHTHTHSAEVTKHSWGLGTLLTVWVSCGKRWAQFVFVEKCDKLESCWSPTTKLQSRLPVPSRIEFDSEPKSMESHYQKVRLRLRTKVTEDFTLAPVKFVVNLPGLRGMCIGPIYVRNAYNTLPFLPKKKNTEDWSNDEIQLCITEINCILEYIPKKM